MRASISMAVAVCGATSCVFPAALGVNSMPRIVDVPANSSPPVPPGLKVTCLHGPNVLNPRDTCPVVKYKGITTWAYSYIDNRVSIALVSYDAKNHIVGNVEKPGARYVWEIISDGAQQTVTIEGQANQLVTARWSELAPK
jgi:hypothetical protein